MSMIKLAAELNMVNGTGQPVDGEGMRAGYRKSSRESLNVKDTLGGTIDDNGRISKGRTMLSNILKVTNSSGNAV
jgi:hypothetical protein